MCAQLSLIRLRCSYEEVVCPCLPFKRIAKTRIRLGGWPRCGFVRFFRWCLDPHGRADAVRALEQPTASLAEQDGAKYRTCEIHKYGCLSRDGPQIAGRPSLKAVHAHLSVTGYTAGRTASVGGLYETRRVQLRAHAILGQKSQKHTENRENACDNCIAGGWFRTDFHGPQTRMASLVLRAGNTRWSHACDLSIRYFMPRSHEALRLSTGHVRTKPVWTRGKSHGMHCERARCSEEFWIVRTPYIPRPQGEHVQLSDMGYERIRAHRRPVRSLPGPNGSNVTKSRFAW